MENLFRKIFNKDKGIEKVVLVGSRAKREARSNSDYDIIIFGNPDDFYEIKKEIDEKIPFKVDLLLEKTIAENVIREMLIGSRLIYKKIDNKSFEKLFHKFLNFENAFRRFDSAVRNIDEYGEDMREFIRDAIIKRYEFTYEMFFKTVSSLLNYNGVKPAGSRDAFRQYNENYNSNSDIELIMDMVNSRNNTSHSYSLEMSKVEFKKITEIYYKEIKTSYEFIKNYIDKEIEIIEK